MKHECNRMGCAEEGTQMVSVRLVAADDENKAFEVAIGITLCGVHALEFQANFMTDKSNKRRTDLISHINTALMAAGRPAISEKGMSILIKPINEDLLRAIKHGRGKTKVVRVPPKGEQH